MTVLRPRSTSSTRTGPAYYARPRFLRGESAREWWTILHPPYTLWHLSYVVIGACLVAPVNATILIATLLAFFLAVGIGAHALDELHGRPLGTNIASWTLALAAGLSIAGAAALGVAGLFVVGPGLAAFIALGLVLVVGYNLELFKGRLHSDEAFALGWGAFPLLTAYFAQHGNLSVSAFVAATFAFFFSRAQRQLSTPARRLRRHVLGVEGTIEYIDGASEPVIVPRLLDPLENALRALSWSVVLLALAMALVQFRVGN